MLTTQPKRSDTLCHATQIRTHHSDYQCHLHASVARDAFLDLYRRRLHDPAIRIPKAVEESFLRVLSTRDPIVQAIAAYQLQHTQDLEQALFAERTSMANLYRLAACDSQIDSAGAHQGMTSSRIQKLLANIGDMKRPTAKPADARVYRDDVAPVAIWKDGRAVMMPMRYQSYPNAEPGSYRHRTSLKEVFGISHGLLLADAFFEKVMVRRTEEDELDDVGPPQEVEMRFAPLSAEPMLLACVWWQTSAADALPGFTILMDLPSPEVACTGHNRCVIPLAPQYVERWLCPNGDVKLAEQILDARVRPYFESDRQTIPGNAE